MKAEIGFINDKAPIFFHRKPIFVCFLAERSDGHLVDFRRVRSVYTTLATAVLTCISAKRFGNGQDILTSADLLNGTQYITCYVMCDEIGQYPLSALNTADAEFGMSWNHAICGVKTWASSLDVPSSTGAAS